MSAVCVEPSRCGPTLGERAARRSVYGVERNDFTSQLHYLNTTSAPEIGQSTVKMIPVADPSTVTKWVASIYFNRLYLTMPPGDGQTVSTSCSIPSAYGQIGLVRGVSHMHSRGVHFIATTSTA